MDTQKALHEDNYMNTCTNWYVYQTLSKMHIQGLQSSITAYCILLYLLV